MRKYLYLLLGLLPLFILGLFNNQGQGTSSIVEYAFADAPATTTTDCNCNSSAPDGSSSSGSDGTGGTGGGTSGDGDACFPAGTMVSTPEGQKEIQDMRVGDSVFGFNTETGAIVASVVIETMKHSVNDEGASPLIVVTHEKGTVTLTTNHPVYKKGGVSKEGHVNFENAGNLKVGDLIMMESGEEVSIKSIAEGPGFNYDYVYNIGVDKVHTYCADGLRVHNEK